jgi:hypothetical protein
MREFCGGMDQLSVSATAEDAVGGRAATRERRVSDSEGEAEGEPKGQL